MRQQAYTATVTLVFRPGVLEKAEDGADYLSALLSDEYADDIYDWGYPSAADLDAVKGQYLVEQDGATRTYACPVIVDDSYEEGDIWGLARQMLPPPPPPEPPTAEEVRAMLEYLVDAHDGGGLSAGDWETARKLAFAPGRVSEDEEQPA